MTLLVELVEYIQTNVLESLPSISFEKMEPLKTGTKAKVSNRVFTYLMNQIYSEKSQDVLNERLSSAYKDFKSTFQGVAKEDEIKQLFFQEISPPFIRSIQEFMNFTVQSYTEEARNTVKRADDLEENPFGPHSQAVFMCVCIILILILSLSLIIEGASNPDAKNDLKGLGVLIGSVLIVACLCGVGWMECFKRYRRKTLRETISSDKFDAFVDGIMASKAAEILKQSVDVNLSDLILAPIEMKGLKDYIETFDFDFQKDLIRMIMDFIFGEKIANILVPVMTRPKEFYAIDNDVNHEDVKLQSSEKSKKFKKGSKDHSLNEPLLTFKWEPDDQDDGDNIEMNMLSIDMSGMDNSQSDNDEKS